MTLILHYLEDVVHNFYDLFLYHVTTSV